MAELSASFKAFFECLLRTISTIFNSFSFVAFLAGTLGLYALVPACWRGRVLLGASWGYFAIAGALDIAVLGWVTLLAYLAGHWIKRDCSRWLLPASLFLLLFPLLNFKYADIAVSLLGLSLQNSTTEIAVVRHLPIGISFYTLQALGYLIDSHRSREGLSLRFDKVALFLGFFPQAVSGPIERAAHIVPQEDASPPIAWENIYLGLKLLIWGFFSKLVLADRLAVVCEEIFAHPHQASRLSLFVALALYSFRIYFDFYGYTCVAIGTARLFGIRLTPNFQSPYLAQSIRDFWRRWHITLMAWFRDYVYQPLMGASRRTFRRFLAVTCVFLISGLWHGAALSFVLWGLYHALLYIVGESTRALRARLAGKVGLGSVPRLHAVGKVLTCFTLVSLGWLPFAVPEASRAMEVLSILVYGSSVDELSLVLFRPDTLLFLGLTVSFFWMDSAGWMENIYSTVPLTRRAIGRELAVMNIMAIALLLLGGLGTREFIYFAF